MSLLQFLLLSAAQPIDLPQWMAGSWTSAGTEGEWAEEWWTPPRAGIMLGAGRSGKSEALGFFEHMRIIRDAEGAAFCAMPQGQAGTCFRAVAANEGSITFENPAHDFPQRIIYRRDGDELIGAVSGLDGSKLQQWRYRRTGN